MVRKLKENECSDFLSIHRSRRVDCSHWLLRALVIFLPLTNVGSPKGEKSPKNEFFFSLTDSVRKIHWMNRLFSFCCYFFRLGLQRRSESKARLFRTLDLLHHHLEISRITYQVFAWLVGILSSWENINQLRSLLSNCYLILDSIRHKHWSMATPTVNRRIMTEVDRLEKLRAGTDPSGLKFLLDQSPVNNPASSIILGRILPTSNIYNQAAFQIEIKLPAEYPFKAPELRFITPIYHPNVDDKGKICVDILNSGETFKPTTSLTEVVRAVVNLIDNPNIDHALTPGNIPSACWISSILCLSRNC